MSYDCHISMINSPFFDFPAIKSLPTSLSMTAHEKRHEIHRSRFRYCVQCTCILHQSKFKVNQFSRWSNHIYSVHGWLSIETEVLFACMRVLARDKITNRFAVICACKIRANYKNYQLVANISISFVCF